MNDPAGDGKQRRMMVTGASGFLGKAVVDAALRAGWQVDAVCRSSSVVPLAWQQDQRLALHRIDFASADAGADLAELVANVSRVIHTAAALSGNDADQARDTIAPTAMLIEAMMAQQVRPRLMLISSLAVYDFAGLPDHALLNETSPLEPVPVRRDAYCRAKLAQEALAGTAAADHLPVCLVRPGAIYGPERRWTWHLGITAAGLTVCVGGDMAIPAIHVTQCAAALVCLAGSPINSDAVPDIFNLVADHPPTQRDWLAALGQRRVLYLPRGPVMWLAAILDWFAMRLAWFSQVRPAALRPANLAARFKPLRYDTAKFAACLTSPQSFAETFRADGALTPEGAVP